MVGRLYWASCARATSIDALLRHSPPASCGRLYPEAAGRRILAGDRLYPASRSRYRRSAASLSPCCAAANIQRQQAGGFRWPAVYTGGGQAVRGQWVQAFCRAALSASFCRQYTATAIQRSRPTPCTTAKPCYCKSCVTAFGGRSVILDKPCVGSGHRCSAAPLSLHRSVVNIRRQRFDGRALHRALPLRCAFA